MCSTVLARHGKAEAVQCDGQHGVSRCVQLQKIDYLSVSINPWFEITGTTWVDYSLTTRWLFDTVDCFEYQNLFFSKAKVTGATAALSQINEQNSQNYCSSLPLPQLRQSKLSMASISKGKHFLDISLTYFEPFSRSVFYHVLLVYNIL